VKSRPEGFPWLSVAGRELTGITVIDLDASVVTVASDQKENAKPTYKGGVGFVPNLATCDNVDDLLMIDPRPGNATSNDAADNIAVLTAAIAAIPGSYRRRVLVRLDGAGFSHKLLEHIATGGGVHGRSWEFSVGWACTDREIDAIDATPQAVWGERDRPGRRPTRRHLGRRHHRPAGPVRVDREDPRTSDHRPGRAAAPQVHRAGQ